MIKEFKGKYRFLSNFYMIPVAYEGIEYPSSEHAFQAAKSLSETERRYIRKIKKAKEAKSAGRAVKIRPDWESIKIEVMETVVRDKFTRHEDLRTALLETGDQDLQEGNTWNDSFWGIILSTGFGFNNLGKALMKIRSELRDAT